MFKSFNLTFGLLCMKVAGERPFVFCLQVHAALQFNCIPFLQLHCTGLYKQQNKNLQKTNREVILHHIGIV